MISFEAKNSSASLLDYFEAPRTRIIRETSLEAYRRLCESGTRQTQAQRLFKILCTYREGLTYNDLRRVSGYTINAICGRMADLRGIELADGDNLILGDETKIDEVTGVANIIWKINQKYFQPSRVVQ